MARPARGASGGVRGRSPARRATRSDHRHADFVDGPIGDQPPQPRGSRPITASAGRPRAGGDAMSFADHQDDWPTMDAGAIEDWRYCDEHHNPGETNAMSHPLRRWAQQRFTLTAWGARPVCERHAQRPWGPQPDHEAPPR